ncbi:MAG: ATP-binding protein [Candidatus Omnitrophica bacterium]|nr:ATP-binding protein [Candidatus Omnitrophota bacterium]
MIKRALTPKLISISKQFASVALTGPRQSGKTTLVRETFPKKPYVLLEDPDTREFAQKDPRGFLAQYPRGAVLDEIQRVPALFSYLQGILDATKTPGLFILTVSHNFLLMEQITQSLAGRVALLSLLPLSWQELSNSQNAFKTFEDHLFHGGYPKLYADHVNPQDLYANYVRTYIDRDVRLLKNVHDLSAFHTFLKLCANRVGQLLNLSSLADECGITHNTAKAWISVLESSYILFLLRPHHNNLNKRLIKTPKIYFYDTGLAAYLMGITNNDMLTRHPLKGNLFECFIISEIIKSQLNKGHDPNIYFWQDKLGREIDCIIENGNAPILVEIKSGKTVTDDYFKNITYWCDLSKNLASKALIVYGGNASQKRTTGHVLGWQEFLSSLPL